MGNTTKKKRQEEAMELALLLYDIYVDTPTSDNIQKGQNYADTDENK